MPNPAPRKIKLAISAALLVSIVATSFACASTPRDASTPDTTVIEATVQPTSAGTPIPQSFMGFSIEWGLIDRLTTPDHNRQRTMINLLNQLKPFNGPLVLRIGGNSQDEAAYELKSHPDLPSFVHIDISKDTLQRLSTIAKATESKYIIGLNLADNKPLLARQLVSLSNKLIGSSNIIDYEIGNEPDLYYRKGNILQPNTIDSYMQRWMVYYKEIQPLLSSPDEIVGPALAGKWPVDSFIQDQHARINLVSLHRYPMGATVTNPASPEFASIPNILNNRSAAGFNHALAKAASVADAYHLPVRFGEMNSAYHSGKEGVSDTFASALWGADTLFEVAAAGGAGADFHMSQGNDGLNGYYDPVSYQHGTPLKVQPVFYGMWMFGRAVQNGGHLLKLNYHTDANVKLWAVEDRSGVVRLVVLNKDLTHDAKVDITLPGYGKAEVIRLVAPGASAKDHVTFGGQTFDGSKDGHPKRVAHTASTSSIAAAHDRYAVDVAHVSGALVVLRPR